MTPAAFTLPVQPDPEQALTFCRLLFSPGDVIHFRAPSDKKGDNRRPTNHHYLYDRAFPETLRQFLAYCGAEQRAAFVLPGPVKGNGTKAADVQSLSAVLMDFDKGDPAASLAEVEELIGPASIVLESGGTTEEGKQKLHAHWLLAEKATGDDITTACRVREELAKRFGGDPSFRQAGQVVRVAGSVHHKGEPKLVKLRTVRPASTVQLSSILHTLAMQTAPISNPPSNVVKFYDFFSARPPEESDTDRVLTQPIHEGAVDDLTRFEGAAKAIGHFIRMLREGIIYKTLDEAWEAVKGWNQATLVPPWPEDRLRHDFQRLVAIDLKTRGAFVAPAPVLSTNPTGFALLDRPADRFVGDAPARQWLVEGLIPLATPGVFAAVGDAGKSMLALRLALFTSCYSPSKGVLDIHDPLFFGCPVRGRGAVVMLTGEDDDAELHRRLNALDPTNIRKGKPLYLVSMVSEGGPRAILVGGPAGPQPTPFWFDLRDQLETIPDLKLVILDPLSIFTSADLNDNAVGAALMTMLATLASKTGAAVMVVHHLNKGSSPTSLTDARNAIRGAGALVDNSRWSLVMWEADDDDKFKALDALGRKEEAIRAGVVYKGGIAKSNAPGKKLLRTLVRGPAGLLEDMTDTIALNTPRNAEIDALVHEALVNHWQTVCKGEWFFSSTRKTKVHEEIYTPIINPLGYGLTVEQIAASLDRLLAAGKIAQRRDKKYEPVVS